MQKVYISIVLFLFSCIANAQLVINENFSGYTTGNLGTQGGWTGAVNNPDVQVANTTRLTYPGYGSGANYITVASADGRDPQKAFSTAITGITTQTIFLSFVVRVSSAEEIDGSPDFSVALRNSADTDLPLRFYIAEDIGAPTTIEFGIAIGGSTIQYTAGNFSYGTTYLIVIRYDISPGATSDDAYLWVNPANFPGEPLTSAATTSTGATIINASEVDFGATLNTLQLFQSDPQDSPDAAFDGFRVAHGATSAAAWSNLSPAQAALPVDIKSLKAVKDNSIVKISWEVGTENNVLGYEIQRSKDGSHFDAIGFVDATAQSNYSYVDNRPLAGTNFYRVVTIDNDRRLKYTSIISVDGRKDLYISRFPNPTTNTLLVQHQEVSSVDATLRVTSLDGKVVKLLRLAVNSVQTNIDVSTLRAGNYVLEFVNGGKRISTTFIKQ